MGTCSSVRQWQPGQRRSGLGKEARQGSLRRGPAHPVGDASGECTWGPRGSVVDVGPLRGVGVGVGDRLGMESGPGTGMGLEHSGTQEEPRGCSPDWVVLRSYWLWAVLGLGGGGKARGISGFNRESSTLRGLLGTHVQDSGRSAWGGAVTPLLASGRPLPEPAPWVVAHLPEAKAGPRLEAAARGPGRARTLRSRRSRAGVCGACGPGRRGGRLHCDPGLGPLTSQNPFLPPGNPPPFQH